MNSHDHDPTSTTPHASTGSRLLHATVIWYPVFLFIQCAWAIITAYQPSDTYLTEVIHLALAASNALFIACVICYIARHTYRPCQPCPHHPPPPLHDYVATQPVIRAYHAGLNTMTKVTTATAKRFDLANSHAVNVVTAAVSMLYLALMLSTMSLPTPLFDLVWAMTTGVPLCVIMHHMPINNTCPTCNSKYP